MAPLNRALALDEWQHRAMNVRANLDFDVARPFEMPLQIHRLIAEGVTPDRTGREYVLRRVMRRAIRHGHRLGITRPFLHEVCAVVGATMGDQYPELRERRELIKSLVEGEEVWLINSHIPQYGAGSWMNHEPRRRRKLLLRSKQIDKLHGSITRQGLTLVPLSIYFNSRGRAKVELALARGKKAHDKRETIKERDWKREQGQLLRQHG